jgi:hypothetical protein
MAFIKLTLIIVLLLFTQVDLQAKEWRGIVPLKSTRSDVERLLGKPNQRGRYEFKEERAYIFYVESKCEKGNDECYCFAPKDVVSRISVTMEIETSFSKLGLDKAKYTRFPQLEKAIAIYSSEEEGIYYEVNEKEDDITHIDYYPSTAHCTEIKGKAIN